MDQEEAEITKREYGDKIYENKGKINRKVEKLYEEVVDLYETSDWQTHTFQGEYT